MKIGRRVVRSMSTGSKLPWDSQAVWSIKERLLDSPVSADSLTKESLEKLAWFAHLKLPEDESGKDKLVDDMSNILKFAAHVKVVQLDTTETEKVASTESYLRPDAVAEGSIQKELIRNAKLSSLGHFIVTRT